jgi:16S rRNA (cytosine967-C5)-methyltransferase
MIAPARRAALDVVSAVASSAADLPDAIARARVSLGDDRDRALLVELATGTIRWLGEIDFVLAGASSRPLTALDSVVRDILRLAVYQLLHLDRVPAAAVVNDAVSMVRMAKKSSASGFTNAVLRRISRSRRSLGLPARPDVLQGDEATLAYLSTTLSHPRWLVERWVARFGADATERWLQFNNRPAPLTLRALTPATNRARVAEELRGAGVETQPTDYAPDGLTVSRGLPRLDGKEHHFVLQDEASQLVGLLATDPSALRALDACAAPGGKTLVMRAGLQSRALLVAADVRPRRVRLLRETLAAAGATNVAVIQMDLRDPLPFAAVFDIVLVDAPCSGLGILRRDPDIKWRRRPEDLIDLSAAQRQMLSHAAGVVAPGGRLVYSTCSSEPEENEGIVESFVPGSTFSLVAAPHVRQLLPAAARSLVDERGYFQTWPWRDGLEAFFGAILQRAR